MAEVIQVTLLAGGTVLVLVLLGAHLYRSVPARLDALAAWWRGLVADARAIDLDAPTLPPVEPLRTPAEIAEVADKTAWLGDMAAMMRVHDNLAGGALTDPPAGPILCDRPARPEPGTDLWWSIRLAAGRRHDARRAARVGAELPPWFAALVNRESRILAKRLAAEEELFRHLTDIVFEPTAEHALVGAR